MKARDNNSEQPSNPSEFAEPFIKEPLYDDQDLDDLYDTVKRAPDLERGSLLDSASSISDDLRDELKIQLDLGTQTLEEIEKWFEETYPEAYQQHIDTYGVRLHQNVKFLRIVRGIGRGAGTIY